MRALPPLVVADQSWTLPFADRSAVALVEELLGTANSIGSRRPTDHLLLDPPLILWTACRAWQRDALQPRSLDRLLQWLLRHATTVLQWDDAVTASEASTFADQEEACAHQVTQDLLTSELAAAQAGENRELAQEAKLLGLLSGARSWFELAAPELDTSTVIPDWLKTADTPPAGHAVALAVQLAQTDELPEEASPDLQARREWANRNAQSWAQSIETIPAFLPR